MPAIRIYEPALCCDTGVCGVDVDQSLIDVTATVRSLQELGADIERHNLASNPTAFTDDETVRGFMHTVGSTGLPLTVVDGVTVATGSYPSRAQLLGFAGLGVSASLDETESSTDGATCDITCRPDNSSDVCCEPASGKSDACCSPSAESTEKVAVGTSSTGSSGCC